jgi:hypothetical protein
MMPRIIRAAAIISCVLSLLIFLGSRRALAGWLIQDVDSPKQFSGTSLVIHPTTGYPALAYGGDAIRLAEWDGTGWRIQTVDDSGCPLETPSLAYDNAGLPAIAYQDPAKQRVKLARFNGTSWDIMLVGEDAAFNTTESLAFDPLGRPAVAFKDITTTTLNYAVWTGSAWTIEVASRESKIGWHSLAFDASGEPGISLYCA